VPFEDLRVRRSRADSAGIGLMVTQRVVTAHSGRIEVTHAREGGARVVLSIPIVVGD